MHPGTNEVLLARWGGGYRGKAEAWNASREHVYRSVESVTGQLAQKSKLAS